jgi:tetratricopeptide (TPR) repeat protein
MRDFQASSGLGDLGMGAFNQGAIHAVQGRPAEALAAFDRAEKEGYNLYNLPFQRGLVLLGLGRLPEAYRQFELARAMNPPSPTRELMLLNLGKLGLQLGKREEALRDLEQLAALQPRNVEGRFLLGMALITQGQHARAKEIMDGLVQETGKGASYYGRALAHYGLKRKAEAMSDIEAALRLGQDNANVREWQAKIRAMP